MFKEESNNNFIKDVIIDTDFEILFPNSYISKVNERLILYTKLSKLNNDDELIRFEKELKDKYGFLPVESIDLLKSVRLKWKAQKLGFEKIVIKKSKMLCYFIFDKNNNFFESVVFKNIMRDIQKFENCELREKNKLYLVFEK